MTQFFCVTPLKPRPEEGSGVIASQAGAGSSAEGLQPLTPIRALLSPGHTVSDASESFSPRRARTNARFALASWEAARRVCR